MGLLQPNVLACKTASLSRLPACQPALAALNNPTPLPHLYTGGAQPLRHTGVQVALHGAHAACCQRISRQPRQQPLQRLPHRQPLAGRQRDADDARDADQHLATKGGGVAVQRVLREGNCTAEEQGTLLC